MKAVHLLINSFLPDELKNNDQTYDTKSVNKILRVVAERYPDRFADILKSISDVGRKASYYQGETITLDDLASPIDKKSILDAMDAELSALPKGPKYEEERNKIFQKYNTLIEKETSKSALANRNNIAMAVLSGARGKSPQLKAMTATPGTFSDYRGRVIPVFSRESFAEGIRPSVFLASTFGARTAVINTKTATAKGGDLSKQFAAAATDLVIREKDCHTENGISLSIDDPSLTGRALARDTAGIPADTFIDRNVLSKLRKAGVENVVARSAITCAVPNGLCAHCVGKFYNGSKLPKIGDSIGLLASSTTGEPITQLALNTKHQGGMTSAKKSYSGIPYLQQFTQSPEEFKDRAAVALEAGKVSKIEDAPQGGYYVYVGDSKHYVPTGHDLMVKVGDGVEAGDQLSEGLVDPEDIIRTKGLGAGRKYYADRLNQMLADSGVGTDPRNTEILARGTIRHIRVDDINGMGNYLPDDIADYDAVAASYVPEEDSVEESPDMSIGKYLQKPALHYSVGTKITPKVAEDLQKNSYDRILTSDRAPVFSPVMVRLRTASHNNPDWLANMSTSHIAKNLNEASTRGEDTNVEHNTDFRPRLAIGVGFGENVRETGEF